MNKDRFYDSIRKSVFRGKLTQVQVDNINVLLAEWESRGLSDLRWLAYILATVYHETGHTMQPVEEGGKGKGKKYGVPDPITKKIYYGRGYSQITWKDNYEKFSKILGIDLVNFPERALETKVATDVIFEGMIRGLFTGKKLSDYFKSNGKADWVGARRIINGTDRAELISAYALAFYSALSL